MTAGIAPRLGWRRPTLSLGAVVLAAAFAAALAPMANNDLWWHLETGRWMFQHHRLPVDDPFSFTGFMRPWHDVEWLSELAMYAVWKVGRGPGLVVGAAVVLAFIFGLVRSLARLTTGSDVLACGILLVAVLNSHYWWAPRPTLASDVCALLTLLILEHVRRNNAHRAIWALPALAAIWANLHGGFVLAPVMVGTVAGAAFLGPWIRGLAPEGFGPRARIRLIVLAVVVPLALLVNANGTTVLSQSVQMFGASKYRFLVDEWTWPDTGFVVTAWCVVAGIVIGARRPVRLSTLGLGVGLTALATSAHRFELYFGLLVLPILGEYLPDRKPLSVTLLLAAAPLTLIPGLPAAVPPIVALSSLFTDRLGSFPLTRPSRWISVGFSFRQAAILMSGVLLVVSGLRRDRLRLKLDHYPIAAIEVLKANRAERVFNLYSWGGWLMWTIDLPTFIDGRSWGGGNFGDYVEGTSGGYQAVFRRYDIRWTLLPPGTMVNRLLSADPAWEQVFADEKAVVFRRRPRRGSDDAAR
jgi:hypothetical protein